MQPFCENRTPAAGNVRGRSSPGLIGSGNHGGGKFARSTTQLPLVARLHHQKDGTRSFSSTARATLCAPSALVRAAVVAVVAREQQALLFCLMCSAAVPRAVRSGRWAEPPSATQDALDRPAVLGCPYCNPNVDVRPLLRPPGDLLERGGCSAQPSHRSRHWRLTSRGLHLNGQTGVTGDLPGGVTGGTLI